jgi:tRNA pseudouridine32 synthase/23S rRNA pseudouridine746 synthase
MSPIAILYEDAEALIVDKPGGLPLTRPRKGGRSLEDRLDELRLGFQRAPLLVHRLDTDTSGCLLLARNPKALKRFGAAFEARQVTKRYLGIVRGVPAEEAGTISLGLAKISSASAGWRMIPARQGKPSITHWRRVAEHATAQHGTLTLIEFLPETGRTHQIRVHAASGLGLPLLGDPVYGPVHGRGASADEGANEGAARTMLHAAALSVPRAGKADAAAVAPMPADFVQLGFSEPAFDQSEVGDG